MKLQLAISGLAVAIVAGTLMYVSNFAVYLGDDPTACNNCHVMDAAYEGWFHGPHKLWAKCNDCHTPHALIPKYITKSLNGFNHVSAFTLGEIPTAIRAKESSREIIQENCVRCHEPTVATIPESQMGADRYCFDCHRDVAHGDRGVSILPYQDQTK
jgi:cytochrome c nitrite reductase small subunit